MKPSPAPSDVEGSAGSKNVYLTRSSARGRRPGRPARRGRTARCTATSTARLRRTRRCRRSRTPPATDPGSIVSSTVRVGVPIGNSTSYSARPWLASSRQCRSSRRRRAIVRRARPTPARVVAPEMGNGWRGPASTAAGSRSSRRPEALARQRSAAPTHVADEPGQLRLARPADPGVVLGPRPPRATRCASPGPCTRTSARSSGSSAGRGRGRALLVDVAPVTAVLGAPGADVDREVAVRPQVDGHGDVEAASGRPRPHADRPLLARGPTVGPAARSGRTTPRRRSPAPTPHGRVGRWSAAPPPGAHQPRREQPALRYLVAGDPRHPLQHVAGDRRAGADVEIAPPSSADVVNQAACSAARRQPRRIGRCSAGAPGGGAAAAEPDTSPPTPISGCHRHRAPGAW